MLGTKLPGQYWPFKGGPRNLTLNFDQNFTSISVFNEVGQMSPGQMLPGQVLPGQMVPWRMTNMLVPISSVVPHS